MCRLSRLPISAALLLSVAVSHGSAQTPRPGSLAREVRAALRPGLALELTLPAESAGMSDTRVDRLPALYLPAGQLVSPFLGRGPFRATWRGYLKLRRRGTYSFHFEGTGRAELHVNGDSPGNAQNWRPHDALQFDLVKGYNSIEVVYFNAAEVAAEFRLYWSNADFPAEPLPTTSLFHHPEIHDVLTGQVRRQGRELFARFRCIRCHDSTRSLSAHAATAMPELDRDAPDLRNVGQRLSTRWLAHWLTSPTALRNDTTMPDVLAALDAQQKAKTAADIAAYLAALPASERLRSTGSENAEQLADEGVELYEARGCIACHRFTPPSRDDEFNRVSLHFVGEKFQRGALAAFLRDSRRHYKWSRMPLFQFTERQSQALAAFLRQESSAKLPEVAQGDKQRGSAFWHAYRCANCHGSVEEHADGESTAVNMLPDVFPWRRQSGCIADSGDTGGNAPVFPWSPAQRDALVVLLQSGPSSLTVDPPAEFAARQWKELRCQACHERDDVPPDMRQIVADEGFSGQVVDPVPPLTWAGEKLQPAWSAQLFAGDLSYRLREHLRTRMPAFPERASGLSLGLSHQHGFGEHDNSGPAHDDEAAKVGEELAGMRGGFACNQCHAIGSIPPQSPDQALATNLAYARDRLRYGYYRRWMRDPLRVDRQTRMVKFAQDGKTTPLAQYYDGDAALQFDAIWHYLQTLSPEGELPGGPK